MTRKQISDARYCQSAKSCTFYTGDQFYEVISWIMENIETKSTGKEGCNLSRKYGITIKILSEEGKDYSKKGLALLKK